MTRLNEAITELSFISNTNSSEFYELLSIIHEEIGVSDMELSNVYFNEIENKWSINDPSMRTCLVEDYIYIETTGQ